MKQKQLVKLIGLLVVIVVLSFALVSCSDSTKPDKEDPAVLSEGNVTGKIRTSTNAILEDATITIGNLSATTDNAGEFFIPEVSHGNNIVVTISKEGYVPTHRTISVTKGRTTYVTANLFNSQISTFPAAFAKKVEFSYFHEGGIDLPADAFVDPDGNAFTGIVVANARYFDPTDPIQLQSFPGNFAGVQTDGTEVPFESFGFISASFVSSDDHDLQLQLGAGKTAKLKVPVPPQLAANAPDTMPLWYFNEQTGKWIEDGVGTKVGNYYEGDVTHFSYWNFDHPIVPASQSTLSGKVLVRNADNEDVPAANADVIAMGVNYSGYTNARTNANGEFSISVKASAQVKLQAMMGSNLSMQTQAINTPAAGEDQEVDDLLIGDMRFRIIGTMKSNTGTFITNKSFSVTQHNPPAGAMPFSIWINTNDDGVFDDLTVFGTPGQTIRLNFTGSSHGYRNSERYFSNPVAIIAPHPGDTFDFGIITCYPAGKIKGKAVNSSGTPFANTSVSFFPEESESEEDFLWANTDENGFFILAGKPNATVRNLIGGIWTDEATYATNKMNMSFPASGQTRDIGNVTFRPTE